MNGDSEAKLSFLKALVLTLAKNSAVIVGVGATLSGLWWLFANFATPPIWQQVGTVKLTTAVATLEHHVAYQSPLICDRGVKWNRLVGNKTESGIFYSWFDSKAGQNGKGEAIAHEHKEIPNKGVFQHSSSVDTRLHVAGYSGDPQRIREVDAAKWVCQ